MLQEFAGGYYMRTYLVQRIDSVDRARINIDEYKKLKKDVYQDVPLVMKLRNKSFVVEGDESTPAKTLVLNKSDTEELPLERNPSYENIMLPKPSVIQTLYI